jgi:hypothetical protein
MPYPPQIRKVNPADTPILVLAVTSDTLPLTTVDAYADNILLQKISQVSGVGLVGIAGEQKAAIRIQLDPQALAARGLSLEEVRSVINVDNVDLPKGTLNSPRQSYTLNTNDQLLKPEAYNELIIAYRNGSPVRVKDVGKAIDGPENNLIAAWYNKQRAIIMPIQRAPGANVIATVDRIKAMMPVLQRRAVHVVADGCAGHNGDLHIPAYFLGDRYPSHHGAAVADRHFRGAVRAWLQPRQPVSHGLVHRGRIRGRRCCRRDREHPTAHRGGPLAL